RVTNDASQRRQHQWRLTVGLEAVKRSGVVAVPHQRWLQLVTADAAVRHAEAVELVLLAGDVGVGQDVHVLIESFIHPAIPGFVDARSEERRVGKECRVMWALYD